MRKILALLALSISPLVATAEVNTFEEAGMIEDVNAGKNLITVNETLYYLPASVQLYDGGAAILKVRPGYVVSFNGVLASPYNRISELYIHPDSVLVAEENMYDFNEQQSRGKYAQ